MSRCNCRGIHPDGQCPNPTDILPAPTDEEFSAYLENPARGCAMVRKRTGCGLCVAKKAFQELMRDEE